MGETSADDFLADESRLTLVFVDIQKCVGDGRIGHLNISIEFFALSKSFLLY